MRIKPILPEPPLPPATRRFKDNCRVPGKVYPLKHINYIGDISENERKAIFSNFLKILKQKGLI